MIRDYTEGLELLYSAVKTYIIAEIVLLAFPLSLIFIPAVIDVLPDREVEIIKIIAIGLFVVLYLALYAPFVALGLFIYATFGKLIPSAYRLARWRKDFDTSAKLIKYGLVSYFLLILTAAILRSSHVTFNVCLFLPIYAYFLVAACIAVPTGFLMLFFKLSSETGVNGFKIAALLITVGIFLGLISLLLFTDPLFIFLLTREVISVLTSPNALRIAGWLLARRYVARIRFKYWGASRRAGVFTPWL